MQSTRFQLRTFESGRRITRRAIARDLAGMGLEFLLLGVMIGVRAWLTTASPPPPAEVVVRFLSPARQAAPRPVEERLSWVGLAQEGVPTGTGEVTGPTQRAETVAVGAPEAPEDRGEAAAPTPEPQRPLSEIEVDSTALLDPSAIGPEYPASMLELDLEGVVLAQFVVDSTGAVDMATFRVVPYDPPARGAFIDAVRAALPRMKYRPAMLAGKRVAQLVEQPFTFRIR